MKIYQQLRNHHEIHIESRSGFIFIIGKYINENFISIPAFCIGCDLTGYSDYFWYNEKLCQFMNPVDATTVAEALRGLSKNKYILPYIPTLFVAGCFLTIRIIDRKVQFYC